MSGKSKASIFKPMGRIADTLQENRYDLTRYRHTPRFAPAGQSTQMIIGATPEDDRHILHLSQSLYRKYHLKRVFYSAYIPVTEHALLPAKGSKPPLLREHRLYQADWLLRFYGSLPKNCWMKPAPILILHWIQNAAGRFIIWSSSDRGFHRRL